MRKIRIKKIDSLAILKISVSICSVLGFIVGVVLGLTSIPVKISSTLNGEIIQKELLTNFWTSLFGVVFGTMFYFIAIALLITLVSIVFNFFSKLTGGIIVEIEKE